MTEKYLFKQHNGRRYSEVFSGLNSKHVELNVPHTVRLIDKSNCFI